MQIAQAAQERMKRGFQRCTRVAPARLLVVAALQVGAGAERAARACDHEAAYFGFSVADLVEGFAKTAEHVDRDRVHHFGMIELQDGDGAVELERDVFELHCFLVACGPRRSPAAGRVLMISDSYLIF